MKNKFLFLIMIYVIMSAGLTTAQTNVSGGIYTNSTWTKVNSPYIVTGDIVLFPDKILTIEPGVEVRFNGNYYIEIRGKLIAIGIVSDSILFISNNSLLQGAWGGINLISLQNGIGFFDFCVVKHSSAGINIEPGMGNDSVNTNYIRNSLFDNNITAFNIQNGWVLPIDSCVFTNNINAIIGSWEVITHSAFTNNNIAVSGSYTTVINSSFVNNGIGIKCENFETKLCSFQNNDAAIDCSGLAIFDSTENSYCGYGIVDSCSITNNNIGVFITDGSITNNIISNNVIGVITGHIPSTVNGIQYYVPIKNNRICNNTQFNVKNSNSSNKNITQNCFCTTDSATIESKLFDGYDDITLGLFNYDIYDSTCQNITKSVYKVGTNPLSSNTVISKEPYISIFPNPFSNLISILFDNQPNQLYSLRIFNTLGQTVQQIENINSEQKSIECGNFKSGIYLLQIIQSGIIIEQQKLIKQ